MQLFHESKFILNALVNFWQFRGISQLGHIHCEEHQVSQKWEKIKITQSIIRVEGNIAAREQESQKGVLQYQLYSLNLMNVFALFKQLFLLLYLPRYVSEKQSNEEFQKACIHLKRKLIDKIFHNELCAK